MSESGTYQYEKEASAVGELKGSREGKFDDGSSHEPVDSNRAAQEVTLTTAERIDTRRESDLAS